MARSRSQIGEILSELIRIPHLQMPLKFNASLLQAESKLVDQWYPHVYANTKVTTAEDLRRYSEIKEYGGVSLYEFDGRSENLTDNYDIFVEGATGVERDPKTGNVLFLPTPQLAKMPYTKSVIDQVTLRKGRTRIMKSDPDHGIIWHSHNRGPWFNPFPIEAIVHIPILTDPRVLHTVRDYRDPHSAELKYHKSTYEELVNDPKMFIKSYGEGECWLFNPWHDHYYHNYSSITRYTILMYVRWLDNEPFLDLCEKALNAYEGPRLDPG